MDVDGKKRVSHPSPPLPPPLGLWDRSSLMFLAEILIILLVVFSLLVHCAVPDRRGSRMIRDINIIK